MRNHPSYSIIEVLLKDISCLPLEGKVAAKLTDEVSYDIFYRSYKTYDRL